MEPDLPCLADEIVEPRPDMNIKVTAFTESKKFYYTICSGLNSLQQFNFYKILKMPLFHKPWSMVTLSKS